MPERTGKSQNATVVNNAHIKMKPTRKDETDDKFSVVAIVDVTKQHLFCASEDREEPYGE